MRNCRLIKLGIFYLMFSVLYSCVSSNFSKKDKLITRLCCDDNYIICYRTVFYFSALSALFWNHKRLKREQKNHFCGLLSLLWFYYSFFLTLGQKVYGNELY